MTHSASPAPAPSSTNSKSVYTALECSFQRNRRRVAALRALAADLEKHPAGDATDAACITAVAGVLLHGSEAELNAAELRYLAAIGVPPELVRGSTKDR